MNNTIEIQDFAQYLTENFCHVGEPLTNKKLQKILYYIDAWHLVYFDSQLFNQIPEAWVHGRVYPTVYKRYKKYQAKPIWIDESYPQKKTDELFNSFGFTDEKKTFLSSVIRFYSNRSALELEILTHRELPWLEAREGLSDYDLSSNPISIETMKNYYTSLKNKQEKK